MADTINFSFYKGEDVTLTVSPSQNVVNITGWSIAFSVRAQPNSNSPVLITKTVGAGVTLSSPTAGQFTVAIADADTASLAAGTYYFDIQRTDNGHVTVMTIGQITLVDEIRI